MRFSDIHGLNDTKAHLIASVQRNQVAHAQLFTGVEGSALLPMALAYATYLNCTNPSDTDACGECSSCSKSLKYIHPDIHFVYPISSTEKITGKDVISKSYLPKWRDFLQANPYGNASDWSLAFGGENKQLNISKEESRQIIDALSLKAFEGRYKIMLIWMPEYLHLNAANGILKILEEPADNTVFLLVSTQKDRLLGTIRSRTQVFRVPRFTDAELAQILATEYQVESTKINQLVPLADGSLRNALKLYEEADLNLHNMFISWMRNCFSNDFTALISESEKFATLSKSGQKTFLLYGLEILREALVANHHEGKLIRVSGEEKEFVIKFGKTLNTTIIDKLSKHISDAYYHLERFANPKMLFMNLSILFAKSFKR